MVPREEGPGGQASKWKERSPGAERRGSLLPLSSVKLVALFSRNFCVTGGISLKEWSCQMRRHVGDPGDPDPREPWRHLRGQNMDLL